MNGSNASTVGDTAVIRHAGRSASGAHAPRVQRRGPICGAASQQQQAHRKKARAAQKKRQLQKLGGAALGIAHRTVSPVFSGELHQLHRLRGTIAFVVDGFRSDGNPPPRHAARSSDGVSLEPFYEDRSPAVAETGEVVPDQIAVFEALESRCPSHCRHSNRATVKTPSVVPDEPPRRRSENPWATGGGLRCAEPTRKRRRAEAPHRSARIRNGSPVRTLEARLHGSRLHQVSTEAGQFQILAHTAFRS